MYDQAIGILTESLVNEEACIDESGDDNKMVVSEVNDKLCALYCNRSATYFSLKEFQKAIEDADTALKVNSIWVKAYLRKGKGMEASLRYDDALKIYEDGLKLDPENEQLVFAARELKTMLDDLEAMQKRISTDMHPDQDKYDRMVQWLISGGSKFPKMYLQYYSEDYRGVHALTKIPPEEVILEVPLKMIMTSDLAKEAYFGKRIVESGYDPLSTHTFLATYLLQEKLKGQESFWFPFIDILPSSYRNMPIFFDEEELSYLKGSFSLKKIDERIESLTKEYNGLCEHIPEFKKFTYEEFVWARLVVITRIFGFYINQRKTDGLVAMADMLNHRFPQDKDVKWQFDDSRNAFTMVSIKTIQANQQIYDSYGRKCNHRFFVNYGFSLEENEDNEVVLSLSFPANCTSQLMKLRILKEAGLGPKKDFQVAASTRHKKSREMFSYLRIANAKGNELMVLPQGNDLKLDELGPLSVESELTTLAAVKAAAEACLEGFDTTLEEDERILKEDKNLTFNIRNAILMRRGEKQVCHWFIQLADEMTPLFSMPWKDLKKLAIKCQSGSGKFDHYILTVVVPLMK